MRLKKGKGYQKEKKREVKKRWGQRQEGGRGIE